MFSAVFQAAFNMVFFARQDGWTDDGQGLPLNQLHPELFDYTGLSPRWNRQGRLVDGAAGFGALWQVMPGWRWLGRLVQWGPVRPVAALAYALFLRLRPLWRRPPPRPV